MPSPQRMLVAATATVVVVLAATQASAEFSVKVTEHELEMPFAKVSGRPCPGTLAPAFTAN